MMGMDRLRDHEQAGSEVVTAADMSCLMHLDGLDPPQRQAAAGDARGPDFCRASHPRLFPRQGFSEMSATKTNHAKEAAKFTANEPRVHWHDEALWFVRAKRDRAAHSVEEWERLRETASQIKLHTLTRLPEYLEQFEQNARRLGAHVHWARDAAEHNEIVLKILQEHGIQKLVKSKSMLTEECHLNPYLISTASK
jgi:hypothetical protein